MFGGILSGTSCRPEETLVLVSCVKLNFMLNIFIGKHFTQTTYLFHKNRASFFDLSFKPLFEQSTIEFGPF